MVKFIIKRIALMVPLMLVVSFLTFLLTYLTESEICLRSDIDYTV